MNTSALQDWQVANQRYLMAAVTVVRRRLENHIATDADKSASTARLTDAQESMTSAASQLPGPAALEMVCAAFDLSPFERDVLLLCAGMELAAVFARLCADAQGEMNRSYPTWSLALDVFPHNHWSALTPDAPLQYWRLIEVGNGIALTTSPLRIDPRVLNYLVGVQHLDERLRGMVEPFTSVGELLPSQQEIAVQVSKLWSTVNRGSLPIIQLCGIDRTSTIEIAATVCQSYNFNLNIVSGDLLPVNISELDSLIRLWEREALLSASVLCLDCHNGDRTDTLRERMINYLISRFQGLLVICSRERRTNLHRPTVTFEVTNPDISEQQLLWHQALGATATQLNGQLGMLISQFNLNAGTIHAVCAEVLGNCPDEQPAAELSTALWNACRTQARPQMDNLAQRIPTIATWDDLILPEAQREILRHIAAHVRQRNKVYETWGFRSKSNRGLGISALFAGDSGTGKTLAAEVLARELKLDLYRIDLSQVVSKYIGETEKNLRSVFDAAENGGVVLLFDEADALFGKRSEVKDSHDRFANIEVSYLLQRMEAYRGLAILTTNLKNSLDTAFLRRIRFIVQFPFPDMGQRAEIWRRIFPTHTPTAGLDIHQLARLNMSGGNIRNIALNAAFLAADANEPVGMKHLLYAARSEYTKLEKSLTDAEVGGWI